MFSASFSSTPRFSYIFCSELRNGKIKLNIVSAGITLNSDRSMMKSKYTTTLDGRKTFNKVRLAMIYSEFNIPHSSDIDADRRRFKMKEPTTKFLVVTATNVVNCSSYLFEYLSDGNWAGSSF